MEKNIEFNETQTESCKPELVKRVRWSVDLEEVYYYVPSYGIAKRFRKKIKKLKGKADDAMKERRLNSTLDFSDAGMSFDKIVEAGFQLFTKKLQFKSKALDFENIRDLGDKHWDDLFELYSPKEFRNEIETDETSCNTKVEDILDTSVENG